MAGNKVGSAYYELSANDAKLKLALASADKQIVGTGARASAGFSSMVSKGLAEFKKSITDIGPLLKQMGAAFAAVKIVSYFGDAIGAASDLNEEIDKSSVVFGSAAPQVQAFADSASNIGLAKAEALGAAGAFGNMFRTIGLGTSDAADMSVRMVQLASDMGSFNNEDPSEMLEKLRSGLSGEAEPLRRFGVLISEAAVKTFAYKNGIAATGTVLTEAQKVQARYGLILEQTALQHGNFADTAGSLANTQRTLAADMTNLSAKVGGVLLPVITALARFAIDVLVPGIEKIGATIGFLMPGIVAVATYIGVGLIPAFVAWAAAAATAAAATIVAMAPVLLPIAAIAAAALALSIAWNNNFLGMRDVVGAVFGFIAETIGRVVAVIQAAIGAIVTEVAKFSMNFGAQGTQVHALADSMGVDFDVLKNRIAARMAESGQSFDQVVAGMKATAADAAAAVPARMEETMREYHQAIVRGGPVISAEAGKVAGMLPSEIKARDAEIRAAAYDNVVAFAAGLLDAQNQPQVALDAMLKAQTEALTRDQEIKFLKGQLGSKALAAGLNDQRPAVSLAAQASVVEINRRLAALGVDGYNKGSAGGAGVSRGLNAAVPGVGSAAARVASSARGPLEGMQNSGYSWGQRLGLNFASGLSSSYYATYQSAAAVASGASAALQIRSPAKKGPLSTDASIWGRKLGINFASGLWASAGDISRAALEAARAAVINPIASMGSLGAPSLASVMPSAVGAGAGFSGGGSSVNVVFNYQPALSTGSSIEIEHMRRMVTDGVTESLERRGRIDRATPHRY